MESTALIITAIITGLIALWCFFIAVRQHMEKGMVFTNAWIYLPKAERAKMNPVKKKLEYRFARNVFFLIGVMFVILTLAIVLSVSWLFIVLNVLMVGLCIYAIVQWVLNERVYKALGIK